MLSSTTRKILAVAAQWHTRTIWGEIPTEVSFEDNAAKEQLKLIAQLNDKDRSIVMEIINTMLTKQKFSDFFQENIQK